MVKGGKYIYFDVINFFFFLMELYIFSLFIDVACYFLIKKKRIFIFCLSYIKFYEIQINSSIHIIYMHQFKKILIRNKFYFLTLKKIKEIFDKIKSCIYINLYIYIFAKFK